MSWTVTMWALAAIPALMADPPLEVQPTRIIKQLADGEAVVVWLTLSRPLESPERIVVVEGQTTLLDAVPTDNRPGARLTVDVPLDGGAAPASLTVSVIEGQGRRTEVTVDVPVPERDWVLHFIPGFHFDPVWWNTQAHFTETGERMGGDVGPGLTLAAEYLRKLAEDRDYTVAFHQLPYLKTFVEAEPHRVPELRSRIAEHRCALVGGSYNELSTTLISAEATAQNAIYGTIFQRDILAAPADVWWQCDVFGHDPSFPSIMSRAGHTAGAFARGPFHQWGAPRDQVNFPSEFEWMAPDGRRVLTHYMTGHYGYAYAALAPGTNRAPNDPERCAALIGAMFEDLRRPALTRQVLLPMHTDFIRPLENLGDVVRNWNRTVVSPRAVMSTPQRFFRAVRADLNARDLVPAVITRDMNPIYTGCAVSYADLKTANRAAETVLRDAEILATWAWLEGVAPYPSAALDRAWRQLLFNAHHDAVTGSMSDQVYLDVMYAYHDALEIARRTRDQAAEDIRFATATHSQWVTLSTVAHARTAGGGRLHGVGLRSRNTAPQPDAPHRQPVSAMGPGLENDHLRLVIDLFRGGAIKSLVDKTTGRELIRGHANELVVVEEYAQLPEHGEGPWHLAPTGETHTPIARAKLLADGHAHRLTIRVQYEGFQRELWYDLRPGSRRLDMGTRIIGWSGRNQLLRVRFPTTLEDARPIYQTAAAIIGRPFARDVDTAGDPWTLDQTCWQWAGLGSVARVEVADGDLLVHRQALGVGEIIIAAQADNEAVRSAGLLAEALVRNGVTTTTVRANRRRYGDLQYDSNTPDFRVALGLPESEASALGVGGRALGWHQVDDDVPILVVPWSALNGVISQLAGGHTVRVDAATSNITTARVADDLNLALINRGAVSMHITPGILSLNLLRSCTSWPAGVWIDGPRRRLPDGATLQTMHGSHVFEYSLMPFSGDYRDAGVSAAAHEINHPVIDLPGRAGNPEATRAVSLVEIDHPDVQLVALRPAGQHAARWTEPPSNRPTRDVIMRLWNGAGRTVTTRVRFDRDLEWLKGVDLLQEDSATPTITRISPRDYEITLGAHAFETVLLGILPARRAAARRGPALGRQPSAYWLENLGEGVVGNGLVALSPEVRAIELGPGDTTQVLVRVVNNSRSEEQRMQLTAHAGPGLTTRLSRRMFNVPPSSHVDITLDVTAANIDGQPVPASAVWLTGRCGLPWEIGAAVWINPDTLDGPAVTIDNTAPIVRSDGVLEAVITNDTAGPLRGEAAWLGPQALWPALGAWRTTVAIPAGGQATITCPLNGALESYGILRFTTAGRVFYGEAVAVGRDPQQVLTRADVDRLRVREDDGSPLVVTALSLANLDDDSAVILDVPLGWSWKKLERTFSSGDVRRLDTAWQVSAFGETRSGTIAVHTPDGRKLSLPANVVPVQRARPLYDVVVVDGDLVEWSASEFTSATSDLGAIRGAVRYGPGGLAVAVVVMDDHFCQEHGGAAIWKGDSIQFGLSSEPSSSIGYGNHDYEYGAGLTAEGPIVWSWIVGIGGQVGLVADAEVAVVVAGDETRYEIRLPSDVLPAMRLEAGSVLGFSYIANDNDGAGFRGAVQWTPGLSGLKDPSMFGDLILMEN